MNVRDIIELQDTLNRELIVLFDNNAERITAWVELVSKDYDYRPVSLSVSKYGCKIECEYDSNDDFNPIRHSVVTMPLDIFDDVNWRETLKLKKEKHDFETTSKEIEECRNDLARLTHCLNLKSKELGELTAKLTRSPFSSV